MLPPTSECTKSRKIPRTVGGEALGGVTLGTSWSVLRWAPGRLSDKSLIPSTVPCGIIAVMRKLGGAWLREPLLHFIVLGLLLFVFDRALGSRSDAASSLARIALTEGDLRQLHVAWMAQWQRAPTPEEMRNLVASRVREEILYREALGLGLDKDDTIIRRRLAQKMEFLADDASSLREPSRAELQAWYGKNGERFVLPARISFHHLYFSVDRRGPHEIRRAHVWTHL